MPLDTVFFKAFSLCKQSYPYRQVSIPASYIVDGKLEGLGYVNWIIQIREKWSVTLSYFLARNCSPFQKTLYLYNDEEKKQFNRCHSYYVDNEDLLKKGGTYADYGLEEIIASLINHAENFDEKTCAGCRGEHPLQTHYIQLL